MKKENFIRKSNYASGAFTAAGKAVVIAVTWTATLIATTTAAWDTTTAATLPAIWASSLAIILAVANDGTKKKEKSVLETKNLHNLFINQTKQ
ncbi:MAG: hypothetical protein IT275_11225 [Chitinophagales bacterium]|nr:hypothetical protein [Chitinophagales bacterium]